MSVHHMKRKLSKMIMIYVVLTLINIVIKLALHLQNEKNNMNLAFG